MRTSADDIAFHERELVRLQADLIAHNRHGANVLALRDLQIRQMVAAGWKQTRIAELLGISRARVCEIVKTTTTTARRKQP